MEQPWGEATAEESPAAKEENLIDTLPPEKCKCLHCDVVGLDVVKAAYPFAHLLEKWSYEFLKTIFPLIILIFPFCSQGQGDFQLLHMLF